MNSLATTSSQAKLSESQRVALISLLADEDAAIYQTVRDKILSYGAVSRDWLRPHTLSSDPLLRRRAQEILQHVGRQKADDRFLGFCLRHGEELDLEQGIWLLAQTQYPDIHTEAYSALLDSWAGALRERLDFRAEAEEVVAVFNQYLFRELGFTGNEQKYYHPENSYLNRVIDRRTGNPVSLCAIYLLVGRRLRLPVTGIGLPGHFLCRYQSATREIYIDPFNRGKLLSKADCVKYLVETSHGLQEGFLSPVSPRRMLMRLCANLHQVYLKLEQKAGAERLQRYLVALAR